MDGLTKSILLWRDWRCMGGRGKNTMTVQFDITETPGYGTYLDDATDMPYGKTTEAISAWQEFFGYKPCLFKNGAIVGYLNPNDYTKFEDGTTADITSGDAGDVMVEFPRRGIKISKSGTTVTVSMTKDDNANGYSYLAHTRGNTKKDKFYIGAYLGYVTGNKLRSLSGKIPTSNTLSNFRGYTRNIGTGYMEVDFYQFLFIQCMYLLEYKGHLNSRTVLGYGYCNASKVDTTGYTNKGSLMRGTSNTSTSMSTDHIKLFGIEDFWGNLAWVLDGYATNNYSIFTATDGFNNLSNGYTNRGTVVTSRINGLIDNCVCSNELGFTPSSCNANRHTYFCSKGGLGSSNIPAVGGSFNTGTFYPGIFYFDCDSAYVTSGTMYGGRLAYL